MLNQIYRRRKRITTNGVSNQFTGQVCQDSSIPCGYGTSIFNPRNSANAKNYTGYWHNGLFHGLGNFHFLDGAFYNGMYQQGKFTGYTSKYCFRQDSCIVGTMDENGPIFGTWTQSDGVYDGYFQNYLPNGLGTMKLTNGCTYSGPFLNGRYHTSGLLNTGSWTTPSGTTYKGSYQYGTPVGVHQVTYPNGSTNQIEATANFDGIWNAC